MTIDRVRSAIERLTSPTDRPPPYNPGVLLLAVWVAVMTFLQVDRQPGVPSWDSIWQEDGGIFLSDALARPFFSTLADPYNAYLHLAPRLIAGAAAALPLKGAAVVLSVGSALVVSVLSVYVYFASSSLLRSTAARVVLSGLFVLLPAMAYETTANAANVHWYLLFACFWVFLVREDGSPWVVAGAAVAVAAVLSDPMAGLFLPLAVLQGIQSRSWRGRLVPIVFCLGLAIQLLMGAAEEAPAPYASSYWHDLPGIFALRVAGSLLVGDRYLPTLWKEVGWAFAYTSLAVVTLVAAYAFFKASLPSRFYLGISFVYSIAFLAVPVMLRGTENFLTRQGFNLNGSRYTVVPILFLVLVVLLALQEPEPRLPGETWRKVQYAFALLAFALVITNYSNFAVRTPGPSWRANLTAARAVCAGKGQVNDQVELQGLSPETAASGAENRANLVIRIAPNLDPPPWAVVATCERIR